MKFNTEISISLKSSILKKILTLGTCLVIYF